MRKPRKLKASREDWFAANRKTLMQRYIKEQTPLLWMAWLNNEYEVYIDK